MKHIIIILFFMVCLNLIAQQQQGSILELKIKKLEQQVTSLQRDIKTISLELDKDYWTYRGVKKETQQKIFQQRKTIDSLNLLIKNNSLTIESSTSHLGSEIEKSNTSSSIQMKNLDNSIERNRLYWIIASLVIVVLGGFIYWLLGKRMRSDKNEVENQIQSSKIDVETQIKNTKTALEEESVKLDNKLVDVLTKQLEVLKMDSSNTLNANENDHSLVLKVADRLNSMEKNLSRMDSKIKGHKNLTHAIKNIKDNYAASGYEIVEMLGKEYNEGMKVIANFIPSEDLETEKQVITRIIKPQVNFKGEMIQSAQIEVSVGE